MSELLSSGRDTGTAGDQVASTESGHLASLSGFTKGWLPPSCSLGVLTDTQLLSPPTVTKGLTACSVLSEPQEKSPGEWQGICKEE